jgi:UPF0755 protein
VAAVYLNRLKKRMRLDADPTVIYGVTQGKGSLGRPIMRADLDASNPYNTYKMIGLPPTPIANPGRAAIEAVLKPATSDDLFFVADGTGGHVFAVNYGDHQKNVAKWRVIERERREQAEAAEAAAKLAAAQAAGNGQSEGNTGAASSTAASDLDGLKLVDIPLPERRPVR